MDYETADAAVSKAETRTGEVTRELKEVRRVAEEGAKLGETLLSRLAALISPVPEKNTERGPQSEPVTPLASDIRSILAINRKTNDQLSFILRGLEL